MTPEDQAPVPRNNGESPFASVRELWAMEQRLLTGQERLSAVLGAQLTGVEARLTAVVRDNDARHESTHHSMDSIAMKRHAAIDQFIDEYRHAEESERIGAAKREGSWRVFTGMWRGLTVLDDHWRIIAIIAGLLVFILSDARVHV